MIKKWVLITLAVIITLAIGQQQALADDYVLTLKRGQNLVSFPIAPTDPNLQTIIAPITSYVDNIRLFDANNASDPWKSYHRGLDQFNDLTTLNEAKAYWINARYDRTLTVTGQAPTQNYTLNLVPGWNTIGWPYSEAKDITSVLSNLTFGTDYTQVSRFNPTTKLQENFENDPANDDFTQFEAGYGYYIYMNTAKTITLSPYTQVISNITAPTTWTLAESPYNVGSNLLVSVGATLTIEPGVEVKFDAGASIDASGEIHAVGTEVEPIVFTSSSAIPAAGDWQSIQVTDAQSVFKHVRVEYSTNGIHVLGSPFDEYDVLIEDSIFELNTHGIYVEPKARVEIYRNDIVNNNVGLYAKYSRLNRFNIKANHNNFENNATFHLQSGFSNTGSFFSIIDATYNWWGTTNLNTINSLIQDSSDGPTYIEVYADVNIDPILGSNTINAVQISNNSVSQKFVDISQAPSTTINYTLDRNATVTINIYDNSENLVRTLVDDQLRTAGVNSDVWDAQNNSSVLLDEGLYIYEIIADDGLGGQGRYGPRTAGDEGAVTVSNIMFTPSTSFDPVKGDRLSVSYQLSDDAVVSVTNDSHAFIEDVPQSQGQHTGYWDGRDLSGNFVFNSAAQIAMSTNKIPETGIALVKQTTLDVTALVADPYLFRPLYSELTQITYTINETADVNIQVLTPSGLSVVTTLEDVSSKSSGTYSLTWDGAWSDGSPVSDEGDYIIRATVTDSNGNDVIRHGNVRILY